MKTDKKKSNVNIKKRIKNTFAGEEHKKHLQHGAYASFMTVIVIAVIFVINLVMGQIPSSKTQIDTSTSKLYSLSDEGRKAVKNISQKVTLYYYVKSGSEDDNISKLLNNFKETSKKIKVEKIDPELHPAFAAKYTSDTMTSGSVIVVSKDRNKILSQSDLYETQVDYQTMSQQVTGFDGEGQIISAINYVTNDKMPVLYTLTGHDEIEMGTNLKSSMEKSNVDMKPLNLLTSDQVPDDAGVLMVGAPGKDLSKEETDKIIQYLENGGKVLMFTGFNKDDMNNFNSILTNYGLKRDPGIVIEGDSSHYIPKYPQYLIPELNSSSKIISDLSKDTFVLAPNAQAIKKLDNYRDTLTIDSLMSTTDKAYIKKVNDEGKITAEKEDGDEEGKFDIGVSVSEKLEDGKTSELVYFSSAGMLSNDSDTLVNGGDTSIVTAAVNSLCKAEKGSSVTIPVKSLTSGNLSMTARDAGFWSVVITGIIPLIFLLTGFLIWMKRRKQ